MRDWPGQSESAQRSAEKLSLTTQAAGAAQLLGLHIDPTHWTLPAWERRIRKRIWWSLITHDKWRALLYGRPCKCVKRWSELTARIARESHNVPIPTVEEGDWEGAPSRDERLSMLSFVAGCHLTEIVE